MVPEKSRQRARDIHGVADRAPLSILVTHHQGADERVYHYIRMRGFQQARPRQTSDFAVGHLTVRRQRISIKTSQS